MRYAHYFASRAQRELYITASPALNIGIILHKSVAGKAEARRIAKTHGAQCWNF